MLESMGWTEDRGIGKNPEHGLKKPIELIPRHHRKGLGADPIPTFMLDKRGKKVAQTDKNYVSTTGKNFNYIGDKLIEVSHELQEF